MDESKAYSSLCYFALKHTHDLNVIDTGLTKYHDGPKVFTVTNGVHEARVWFDPKTQLFHWDNTKCQGAKRILDKIALSFTKRSKS